MRRGIQDGPYGCYIDPALESIKVIGVNILIMVCVGGAWAISDGPDIITVTTPDGVERYTPHDFCSDFPASPYCKRLAEKAKQATAPAPAPKSSATDLLLMK